MAHDNQLERRAKKDPEALFHLHVGKDALSKVEGKSKIMELDALEREAIRGMHLAAALDDYADMYHIGRLVGVPPRQERRRNVDKGEAFWRGFQIARGYVVLANGFRSTIDKEERFATWLYAKSVDYDCAMQGFRFGAPSCSGGEISTYSDILHKDDCITPGPSNYLESVARLISAIENSESDYFLAS
ncbi:hypothetical protein [Roseovarius nanhaiticus]|uniref:hypothetical protein n=1 Tax=Roseovarius nanhaiticus TaxID=573024 RepID=UPI002492C46E|nr:hypothetical protein [Roseovarius nanhaiticus]